VSAPAAFSPKCFFVGWISAWFIAIYAPSAMIALAGASPLADGRRLPAATFAIADQVAPAAKLAFAALLALMLLLSRRLALSAATRLVVDMSCASAAMLLVVALLPAPWSRGFGVGLAGDRFALAPLAMYLAGALLAGLAFSLSETRCRARAEAHR
jgi:hypothetical protein